jgi:transposase
MASGLSRMTITKGMKEVQAKAVDTQRIRHKGGGRPALIQCDLDMTQALENLLEASTRGDPQSPLRWTCKSTRSLSAELSSQSHPISHTKIAQLLHDLGYSLQSNRKTKEGESHPDRDAQFHYINKQVQHMMKSRCPVISVDTKKKELLGNYANKGRQWLKAKQPRHVNDHDFPDSSIPRAYPYGVYDIARNRGFVNVGTDHDTSAFAVASIRGWWRYEGKRLYANAKTIFITADGGGSNSYRTRLWKVELHKLSQVTGMMIQVSHFPPGTSKWNKIEHRLFSFISSNWRGEPLRDYETVVKLIAHTTTAKGLAVTCRLDRRKYPIGCKVTDQEFAAITITPQAFHGEWNYTIYPEQQ